MLVRGDVVRGLLDDATRQGRRRKFANRRVSSHGDGLRRKRFSSHPSHAARVAMDRSSNSPGCSPNPTSHEPRTLLLRVATTRSHLDWWWYPGEVGQVSIWSLQGEELQHHALQPDMVQKILVMNNESWIAPGWDSVIPVGKVDSFPKTERTYEQHSGPILDAVAIQREGLVITCGVDQTIQVWNPQQAKRILTMDQHTGRVLALSLRQVTLPNRFLGWHRSAMRIGRCVYGNRLADDSFDF